MLCPHCNAHVLERWQPLYTKTDAVGNQLSEPEHEIPNSMVKNEETQSFKLSASWMECPNDACNKVIVTVDAAFYDEEDEEADDDCLVEEDSWIAFPRRASARPVDGRVPAKLASDYREATAILGDSPKASAAIARRILADVLEQYGGYADFQLSKRIEAFAADGRHPSSLRDNARYLTQIGNFAAHTQKDAVTNEIVDVEPGEAEWTLEVIDGLFDYFIVGPAKDEERRKNFDLKIQRTGRKPVRTANGKVDKIET